MTKAKFKSATIYDLSKPLSIDQINDLPLWEQPNAHSVYSIGLTPIYKETAVPLGNAGVWFRLRRSERKISKSEMKLRITERVSDLEQKLERKIRGKEKLDIRDSILVDLLPTAQPHLDEIDVMFRDGSFIVCSSNPKVSDGVTSFLREKLGDFKIVVAEAENEKPLNMIGKGLLNAKGLILDNVQLGEKVSVTMADDSEVVVKKSQYDTTLLKLLQEAATVNTMSIEWGDYTANLKPDLTSLSGIVDNHEPSEDFSAYEDKAEREALESRARAEMFVTSMPRLFRELAALGGGLAE